MNHSFVYDSTVDQRDFGLVFLAFLSEVIGTLSGFGSSTFFVPLASIFENVHMVLVLTALLHCFGNLFRLILFRKHFILSLFLKLFVPSVIFTGIGALFTTRFSPDTFRVALGVFLILIPFLIFTIKRNHFRLPTFVSFVLTALSGFATGLVGTGGAVRGVVLSTLHLEKSSFVMLSTSIDFGGDLIRASIYLKNGFMDWSHWYYVPLLGVAALLGARLGKILLGRMNQQQFEHIVSLFVFLSGVSLLLK